MLTACVAHLTNRRKCYQPVYAFEHMPANVAGRCGTLFKNIQNYIALLCQKTTTAEAGQLSQDSSKALFIYTNQDQTKQLGLAKMQLA